MAGVNNQRIEGVRKNRKHKEGPEIAMGEGVWVRNPKGHYGEGLAFLEFSTRGLRRDNPKSFLSLGRAIIVRNGEIIPMSREFTPETERQRLQQLGFLKPELLGGEFTHLEFPRRVQPKELGQRMLYRDQNMTGWAYKKIELEDLRFPLVCGEGKKARVMATIGVTRGLGDHNLKVCSSTLPIKPFLSCFPEVRVYDLTQYEHCPDDVLVLGTDGLWDVTSDSEVHSSGPSSGSGGPGHPPGPWLASPQQQAGFRG